MKLFRRSDKNSNSNAEPRASATRDLRELLPGLIPGLIGLALAAGLLWGLMQYGNQRLQEQLIGTWSETQSQALQKALQQLRTDTLAAAGDPAVVEALRSQDPQQLRELERRLSYRAGVVDVHLSLRGRATQNTSREAPINFAALDLLRRAEFGQAPAPEAYRIGQRWLIYHAVDVRPDPQAPALGTLLFASDLSRLLGYMPALPAEHGQLRLTQQFANAPLQELATFGSPWLGAPKVASSWSGALANCWVRRSWPCSAGSAGM